jgi:hypothetical protein
LWLVVQMQKLQHEITWMQAQQSENQMKHVRELEVQVPYKGHMTVSTCVLQLLWWMLMMEATIHAKVTNLPIVIAINKVGNSDVSWPRSHCYNS